MLLLHSLLFRVEMWYKGPEMENRIDTVDVDWKGQPCRNTAWVARCLFTHGLNPCGSGTKLRYDGKLRHPLSHLASHECWWFVHVFAVPVEVRRGRWSP